MLVVCDRRYVAAVIQEHHKPVKLMSGFDRFMHEVTTYLAFWDEARTA